jgi:hypothetical protein
VLSNLAMVARRKFLAALRITTQGARCSDPRLTEPVRTGTLSSVLSEVVSIVTNAIAASDSSANLDLQTLRSGRTEMLRAYWMLLSEPDQARYARKRAGFIARGATSLRYIACHRDALLNKLGE